MSGRSIGKLGAGSGVQLAETDQVELIFSLHLKLKPSICPAISLAVGQLSSNGYLKIVEQIWKV